VGLGAHNIGFWASPRWSLTRQLENVERIFRAPNTDLRIRPIRHRLEDRIKARVLICMLAYYITWHSSTS
jgi:transposase